MLAVKTDVWHMDGQTDRKKSREPREVILGSKITLVFFPGGNDHDARGS